MRFASLEVAKAAVTAFETDRASSPKKNRRGSIGASIGRYFGRGKNKRGDDTDSESVGGGSVRSRSSRLFGADCRHRFLLDDESISSENSPF